MNLYSSKNLRTPEIIQQENSIVLLTPVSEKPVISGMDIRNLNFSFVQNTNKSELFIHQRHPAKIKLELKSLVDLAEVVKIAEKYFHAKKQGLVKRLNELLTLYDESEDDDISVESLKSMLIFLSSIGDFTMPTMTLNETGTFQINWRKSNSNLMTLRFKNNGFVDYAIFQPSQHIENTVIINGNMNLFDFIDHINDFNLMTLIKS